MKVKYTSVLLENKEEHFEIIAREPSTQRALQSVPCGIGLQCSTKLSMKITTKIRLWSASIDAHIKLGGQSVFRTWFWRIALRKRNPKLNNRRWIIWRNSPMHSTKVSDTQCKSCGMDTGRVTERLLWRECSIARSKSRVPVMVRGGFAVQLSQHAWYFERPIQIMATKACNSHRRVEMENDWWTLVFTQLGFPYYFPDDEDLCRTVT